MYLCKHVSATDRKKNETVHMHVRSFATTVAIPTCIFGWISFFSEVVRNCIARPPVYLQHREKVLTLHFQSSPYMM